MQICVQIYWTCKSADSIVTVSMSVKERPVESRKLNLLKPKEIPREFRRASRSSVQAPAESNERRLRGVAKRQLMNLASKGESIWAEKLVKEVEGTDNSDVVRLCETYGLKRGDLGRLTGFSLRALADWSNHKLPSTPARRRLHEVRRLLDALAEVVKLDVIPNWLKQRNPAFDNMTPLQVIELGEVDRLWQLVYELGSGNPD